MKVVNYREPKSSFLSIEKDLGIITEAILKNKNLKKLLFYNSSDALNRAPISEEDSLGLINKNIKIVPKLRVDTEMLNYILISFDNFTENERNPEFRDNYIVFDIICHLDLWQLEDFQLRPYRIAAASKDQRVEFDPVSGIKNHTVTLDLNRLATGKKVDFLICKK